MTARKHLASVIAVLMMTAPSPADGPDKWYRDGRAAVESAKRLAPNRENARNVILFIGDGMGVSTVTAARILAGQIQGTPGEEKVLNFEKLPYTALIKTYNTNQQTPDSAGTMTAMVTGVKTKAGVLSMDERTMRGDHADANARRLTTILELAERAGLSTGIVTTSSVTHATPAALYAHSPERAWQSDGNLPGEARSDGFPDIARQLIEFAEGNGVDVVLGGGRAFFLPDFLRDPEHSEISGQRRDGRDLTAQWVKSERAVYVWNKSQFDAVDASATDRLLGLFEPDHMNYEHDRASDKASEPSLSEMTARAVDLLSKNSKGFFLMVEGARIDHAHHATNPFRALTETIEFDKAVAAAKKKTNSGDTLIIVTADHGSSMTMGGYATRGNPILGKVVHNNARGEPASGPARDALGLPYATLNYAAGPGYHGASAEQPEGTKRFPHDGDGFRPATIPRPDLSDVDTQDPDYLGECMIPLGSGVHSGEDVPLYAGGPGAYMFHGVLEQNVIFHVMADALGLAGPERQ